MEEILKEFLIDDEESRDIVEDLANKMGVFVQVGYFKSTELGKDFFALTIVNKREKKIMINVNKIKNEDTRKFILAYQLVQIIKSDNEELYSLFEIDNLDMNLYDLTKEIIDRSNKYKRNSQIKKWFT